MPLNALFGLAFAPASPHGLTSRHTTNSQAHSSKGTPSPPTRGSDGLYATGFRYYFTPLPGYFSPFPHGTGPLSVIKKYLGLSGGPDRFTPDFTGPVLLGKQEPSTIAAFTYGTLTHYGAPFQTTSANDNINSMRRQPHTLAPTTPHTQRLPA